MTNEKKKILVVEDEEALSRILQDEFTSEGYDVHTAMNGQEGLEKALKLKPDLILLDIVMPKMNGMEMLHKLREDKWGKTAQALILTNLEGNAERTIEALDSGVFEFVVKTRWQLEDLKKHVKEKLEK